MTLYKGRVLNFDYEIDLPNEQALEEWLIGKLKRYRFNLVNEDLSVKITSVELRVIQAILGVEITK